MKSYKYHDPSPSLNSSFSSLTSLTSDGTSSWMCFSLGLQLLEFHGLTPDRYISSTWYYPVLALRKYKVAEYAPLQD